MANRICNLFGIKYPIIQGGMVWCSGYKLASSVSNCGGLGLIGAGSMHPEMLLEHIQKAKMATKNPFGVNIPLLYPQVKMLIDIIIQEEVKIVFTSAGNPKTWTKILQDHGITVVHVVSSAKFARKAEDAGVNAIVAEGFEAGGHNGREETTTLTLIPTVRMATSLPLMAAGGIGTGESILAAMLLGADGVQIGSAFAVSQESSASQAFKQKVIDIGEGETMLSLKKLAPVRLIKNEFYETISQAEANGATADDLSLLLGNGRAKKGIFEGDIVNGELEIGQISSIISRIQSTSTIFNKLLNEYQIALSEINNNSKYHFTL
jgi:Dioxygenases related to 2-nitropropane dioxygenase